MKKAFLPWAMALLSVAAISTPAGASDKSAQATTVETLVKSSTSWDGATLPAYPAGQPEVTLLRITIPAGQKLPIHTHPVINVGLLLKGELTVQTEAGKTLVLRAGDPIVETVNTWHHGQNTGAEPAEIVVFYAGARGQPITQAR